jgi:hypothetical protein
MDNTFRFHLNSQPGLFIFARLRFVLRQPLYQMIQAQPDAPTVMIEGYWKQESGDEQDNYNQLVIVQQK